MKMFWYIIAFIAVVAFTLTVSFLKAGVGHGGMRIFVDLLFIVGAIIMGIGAFIYYGESKPSFEEWYAHSTKGPDRQVEIFLEYRKKQWRHGVFIIIFGLALICLSVAIGTFL
mgnify:CR=1 FL=1